MKNNRYLERIKKIKVVLTDVDGVIDACGREWHTVLVSGLKNGGGALTALDVTNMKCANDACTSTTKNFADGPDYPEHLWTVFARKMGNSWSQSKVGRVRMNYNDVKIGKAHA